MANTLMSRKTAAPSPSQQPFDEQLAALSQKLDETRLFYGSSEEKVALRKKIDATTKLHAKSSVQSLARRAVYNSTESGEFNLLGESDLVSAVESGRVDVSAIDKAVLPESLQSLSKDELRVVVTTTAQKRGELNREIKALAKKRQPIWKNKLTLPVPAKTHWTTRFIKPFVSRLAKRQTLSTRQNRSIKLNFPSPLTPFHRVWTGVFWESFVTYPGTHALEAGWREFRPLPCCRERQ